MKRKYLFPAYLFTLTIFVFSCSIKGAGANSQFRVPLFPPSATYTIKVEILAGEGSLLGTQLIHFKNESTIPLPVLALDWRVGEGAGLGVTIEGRDFELIHEDMAGQGKLCSFSPSEMIRRMRSHYWDKMVPRSCGLALINLTEPLLPGESIAIVTQFYLHDFFLPSPSSVELVNWFPKLWWSGQETFDSYDVQINSLEGYVVIASGAEDPLEPGRFANQGARSFGIYIGKNMLRESRLVEGVTVVSVFSEDGIKAGRLCLETAVDVVSFYKNWVGFYPFDFLYIIPGRSRNPVGGFPVATGIVAIHGQENFNLRPETFWQWITAHEIGHQFWGEFIMESDDPGWLWIGLGLYGDMVYLKNRNIPKDQVFSILNTYTRETYFQDTSIDIPPHLVRDLPYDHNNVVVHGKGLAVVSALSTYLGHDRFDELLSKAFELYGRKGMGYRNFQHLAERVCGENLSWFFETWVRSPDYLSCKLANIHTSEFENGFRTEVTVDCSEGGVRMPVTVKARFTDGEAQVQITNHLMSKQMLVFHSESQLDDVELNPQSLLPMVTPLSELLKNNPEQYIMVLPWTGSGDQALHALGRLSSENKLAELSVSPWTIFKLGLLLYDGKHYLESLPVFELSVNCSDHQLQTMASYVWLGHVNDILGKREEAIKYYTIAQEHSGDGTLTQSQYNMRINEQWIRDRLEVPFERTHP